MKESDESLSDNELSELLRIAGQKRREYVLLALGHNFDKRILQDINVFVRDKFPNYVIIKVANVEAFNKYLSRQVKIVVIDDDFASIAVNISLIKNLKINLHNKTFPAIFITDNSERLIGEYNKELKLYQESDNYILKQGLSFLKLKESLLNATDSKLSRKTKRYNVNIELEIKDKNEVYYSAKVENISLQGAFIYSDDKVFIEGEQLRIRFSVRDILPVKTGEFLWLSLKVRRVFISGNKAGVSWENLTETQRNNLGHYIISQTRGQI